MHMVAASIKETEESHADNLDEHARIGPMFANFDQHNTVRKNSKATDGADIYATTAAV